MVALTKPPLEDEQSLRESSGDLAARLNQISQQKKAQFQAQLKENMMSAQVEAALQGHDLRTWKEAEDEGRGRKWQARCRKCGMIVYVSNNTLYSLLEEECEG